MYIYIGIPIKMINEKTQILTDDDKFFIKKLYELNFCL